jgi:hypothetical protein
MHQEATRFIKVVGSTIFRDSCTVTVVDERRVILSVGKAWIPCSAFGNSVERPVLPLRVQVPRVASTLLATYAPVVHKITPRRFLIVSPSLLEVPPPPALAYARQAARVLNACRWDSFNVLAFVSYPTRLLSVTVGF